MRLMLSFRDSRRLSLYCTSAFAILLLAGCTARESHQVVVYAALDREFSEPILKRFETTTGVRVKPKFDVESTKTVGLVNAIIEESARPRCDVFWNNEILHALRLKRLGLLEVYAPPTVAEFPTSFRDPDGTWHGFAARARVLVVNRKLLGDRSAPTSVRDLADAKWRDQCCLAKPLHGTTATHAAALFALWGKDEASKYFQEVSTNAVVVGGNKQVAIDVAAGRYVFGLTDTDDAVIERDRGAEIDVVFPDQPQTDALHGDESDRRRLDGTLFIPNTLCLVKNSPHPKEAQKLVDFLLTATIEDELAYAESAQIPLSSQAKKRSRALPEGRTIVPQSIDYEQAAAAWDESASVMREIFAR